MPDIEYFYAAHSAYAYIGSARLMQIAADTGAKIVHKPMDLRRVVAATSGAPTNSLTEARRAYFSGRQIERWAEARGVAIMAARPTHHDNPITLPNCVLIAAEQAGHDIDALAHAMLEAHWRDDADLADAGALAGMIHACGLDAEALLAAAEGADIAAQYEANTAEAIERSVFGSPTYFVRGDMFYGQDHLELVARALERPFAGTWPKQ